MMTSHYFIIDSPSDSQNPLIFDSPSNVGQCRDSDMFDSVRCRMGIGVAVTVLFSAAAYAAERSRSLYSTPAQSAEQSRGLYSTPAQAAEQNRSLYFAPAQAAE